MGYLNNKAKYILFLTVYLLLFVLTCQNPLFWDTVQFSGRHPNWYYHTQFRHLLLPDYCDSGHPPAFGMYIAFLWMLFGKSLAVTHLAMLPFIILLVVEAVKLGNWFFPADGRKSFLLTAIILTEGVLLAQCSLVSPDILVVAFFLTGLRAVMTKSSGVLLCMVVLMSMLSMRAMMCCVALYMFFLIFYWPKKGGLRFSYFLNKLWPFIPGGILSLAYLMYHYYAKGWTGYHVDSPWAEAFERADIRGFFKNVVVLGWRLMDIGKVATFITFIVLVQKYLRRKLPVLNRPLINKFLGLVLCLFVLTALPLTLYNDLLMHRYIIPLYLAISMCTFLMLLTIRMKWKYHLAVGLIVVQLSGHFWSYPRPVSQGWDATLSHLPYFALRSDFKQYMQDHAISPDEVATAFPMAAADSFVALHGSKVAYKDFRRDPTEYVWYSNVSNAMLKDVNKYCKDWEIIHRKSLGHVDMILFRKSKIDTN